MKKTTLILICIVLTLPVYAQFMRPSSGPERNFDRPDKVAHASMGIGVGPQFGAVGFRFQLTSNPFLYILQASAFAGGGVYPFFSNNSYSLVDKLELGYTVGAKLHLNIAYLGISYGLVGYEGFSRQTATGQTEYKDISPLHGPAALVGFEGNLFWLGWSMVNYTAGAGLAYNPAYHLSPFIDVGVHFRL